MLRRMFTLLSAVSLLLCVATCVLWVRSFRVDAGDRLSTFLPSCDARYALCSDAGRLVLSGPPPAPSVATRRPHGRTAREVADRLTARRLTIWWGRPLTTQPPRGRDGELNLPWPASPEGDDCVTLESLTGFDGAEFVRPFLRALEDPDRFAVAHLYLTLLFRAGKAADGLEEQPGGPVQTANGLRMVLRPDLSRENRHRSTYRGGTGLFPYLAVIDPAQLPAIRDQWHRRLDVPVASVPHWSAAAAAGVLPVCWVGAAVTRATRARSRRRVGLCPSCSYDLCATPGLCPECGRVPAAGRGL